MCGMTGWVDFERNLTNEETTLQRMVKSLSKRGPDAEGCWLSRHAALGHRRLAVIDLEGGRQPMVYRERDEDLVCLVYTGETYNFKELRRELGARGQVFHTASDTEVLLRAYLEWGEEMVNRLEGMYALAIWDQRTAELLLFRDRLGIKPLYYYELPTGILFGSEPKAIFASGLVEPIVEAEGLCELLSLIRTPGEAVFRGMREAKPGELIRFGRDGLFKRRYWRLEASEHHDDLKTTTQTVRGLLEEIVEKQLVSDVPLCSMLSGGLDSSLVTALAQQKLRHAGARPLRTLTVDFKSSAGQLQPDGMRSTSDSEFAPQVVERLGTDHNNLVLDSRELVNPEVWRATLEARDLPPLGDMDTSFYLLCKTARQHSTVALSGEGADELFGGYAWFHDPKTTSTESFPWLVAAGRLGRQAVFEPRLRGGLNLAAYQTARYQEAIKEVPRLSGEEPMERRMREISYLHLTRFLPIPLDRKDRLSMAVGLEVRVPYCDHRLVAYVFNVPWALKTFDFRDKSLLRAAGRDLLPASVIDRAKTAFPTTQDPAYHQILRNDVSRLLATATAPVLPLLNRPAARALAAMPPTGSQLVRMGLERILHLNQWLEHYRVQVNV